MHCVCAAPPLRAHLVHVACVRLGDQLIPASGELPPFILPSHPDNLWAWGVCMGGGDGLCRSGESRQQLWASSKKGICFLKTCLQYAILRHTSKCLLTFFAEMMHILMYIRLLKRQLYLFRYYLFTLIVIPFFLSLPSALLSIVCTVEQ